MPAETHTMCHSCLDEARSVSAPGYTTPYYHFYACWERWVECPPVGTVLVRGELVCRRHAEEALASAARAAQAAMSELDTLTKMLAL